MPNICGMISRRQDSKASDHPTVLNRILKLHDLIGLGVGSTLGLGVYVLAGQVGYNVAGPGVIISFLIAGITSIFAAACYAEFASRVSKSGSAYTYSYVAIGELVAFTIGWTMVLEYMIGTASLARGLTSYLDANINKVIEKKLSLLMPIHIPFMAAYPDFLSFGFVILVTILIAVGIRESNRFNLVCTAINLLTMLLIIGSGTFHADLKNWNIPSNEVPKNFGVGGFLPFGLEGVMAGAAKCFFGFVGFDGIGTVAEEAINPRRNIPLSMLCTTVIVLIGYLGIAIVLTLMVPYFRLNPSAPFPMAFKEVGWLVMKDIVSVGAIFALTTALLGCMFPLPRVLYSMASDGIIYRFLSKVNSCTKTPLIATIISGSITAILSLLFDLHQLVDMMSIGTLASYSIVAICVIILRYRDEHMDNPERTRYTIIQQLYNGNSFKTPNVLTFQITKICIMIFGLISVAWCSIISIYKVTSTVGIITTSLAAVAILIILIIIARQPQSEEKTNYRVPLVPFIPSISIFINLYLMFELNAPTWIRLTIWMAVGYVIYFTYGLWHSSLIVAESNVRTEVENT